MIDRAHWLEADRAAFWDALSDQGRRMAVLDVPKRHNPRPLKGIHLTNWSAHRRYFCKPKAAAGAGGRGGGPFGLQPPSRATRNSRR